VVGHRNLRVLGYRHGSRRPTWSGIPQHTSRFASGAGEPFV
jgi:hypothetical protein